MVKNDNIVYSFHINTVSAATILLFSIYYYNNIRYYNVSDASIITRVVLTLQPSQVKAPKWNPAAGSPQTLHCWFICKKKKNNNF